MKCYKVCSKQNWYFSIGTIPFPITCFADIFHNFPDSVHVINPWFILDDFADILPLEERPTHELLKRILCNPVESEENELVGVERPHLSSFIGMCARCVAKG